jgi:hypothetical protein
MKIGFTMPQPNKIRFETLEPGEMFRLPYTCEIYLRLDVPTPSPFNAADLMTGFGLSCSHCQWVVRVVQSDDLHLEDA